MAEPANFRCLSIRQPWAWAICAGLKRIENRSWSNAYRGPVAIHAGASRETLKHLKKQRPEVDFDGSMLTLGAIVGVAELVDVAELSPELEADDDATAKCCWIFERGRLLAEPIPCKGKLTLYHLDAEMSARIRQALEAPSPRVSQEIIESYQRATKALPNDLCYWRATAYSELGKLDDAIRQCTRAIEAGPPEPFFYLLRAACRLDSSEVTSCLADCEQGIRLAPESSRGYWLRSQCYEALGQADKAAADWRRALELEPDLERNLGLDADGGEPASDA